MVSIIIYAVVRRLYCRYIRCLAFRQYVCDCLATSRRGGRLYLSTKNTILKKYDGRYAASKFRQILGVYIYANYLL
jgi:hypothetical protein